MTIAPRLISSADCRLDLDFAPRSIWPELLPGVAVNGFAWAGFRQPYFLDHTVDFSTMPARFRELHPDLSFVEIARLALASEFIEQFPFEDIYIEIFGPLNKSAWDSIHLAARLPETLANWAMERRLRPEELNPLAALLNDSPGIFDEAASLFADLQRLEVPRAEGAKVLQLLSELLLEGTSPAAARANADDTNHSWYRRLRDLRHPLGPRYDLPTAEKDIDQQIKALQKMKEELRRAAPYEN